MSGDMNADMFAATNLLADNAQNKAVSRVVTEQYLSEQVLDNLAYVINGIRQQVMYSINDCREQADFTMIELTMLLRRLFKGVL